MNSNSYLEEGVFPVPDPFEGVVLLPVEPLFSGLVPLSEGDVLGEVTLPDLFVLDELY